MTLLSELQAKMNVATNPKMKVILTARLFSRNSLLENMITPLPANGMR